MTTACLSFSMFVDNPRYPQDSYYCRQLAKYHRNDNYDVKLNCYRCWFYVDVNVLT
jgi:hypothetical protein